MIRSNLKRSYSSDDLCNLQVTPSKKPRFAADDLEIAVTQKPITLFSTNALSAVAIGACNIVGSYATLSMPYPYYTPPSYFGNNFGPMRAMADATLGAATILSIGTGVAYVLAPSAVTALMQDIENWSQLSVCTRLRLAGVGALSVGYAAIYAASIGHAEIDAMPFTSHEQRVASSHFDLVPAFGMLLTLSGAALLAIPTAAIYFGTRQQN